MLLKVEVVLVVVKLAAQLFRLPLDSVEVKVAATELEVELMEPVPAGEDGKMPSKLLSSKLPSEAASNVSVEDTSPLLLLLPLKRSGQMLEKRLPITSVSLEPGLSLSSSAAAEEELQLVSGPSNDELELLLLLLFCCC